MIVQACHWWGHNNDRCISEELETQNLRITDRGKLNSQIGFACRQAVITQSQTPKNARNRKPTKPQICTHYIKPCPQALLNNPANGVS